MARRNRPLKWYDATVDGIGIRGKLPDCTKCCDMLFSPLFVEAVYSVAIEHPADPADMGRQTIDSYHAEGHPEGT